MEEKKLFPFEAEEVLALHDHTFGGGETPLTPALARALAKLDQYGREIRAKS